MTYLIREPHLADFITVKNLGVQKYSIKNQWARDGLTVPYDVNHRPGNHLVIGPGIRGSGSVAAFEFLEVCTKNRRLDLVASQLFTSIDIYCGVPCSGRYMDFDGRVLQFFQSHNHMNWRLQARATTVALLGRAMFSLFNTEQLKQWSHQMYPVRTQRPKREVEMDFLSVFQAWSLERIDEQSENFLSWLATKHGKIWVKQRIAMIEDIQKDLDHRNTQK